jgi:hypothetical protein
MRLLFSFVFSITHTVLLMDGVVCECVFVYSHELSPAHSFFEMVFSHPFTLRIYFFSCCFLQTVFQSSFPFANIFVLLLLLLLLVLFFCYVLCYVLWCVKWIMLCCVVWNGKNLWALLSTHQLNRGARIPCNETHSAGLTHINRHTLCFCRSSNVNSYDILRYCESCIERYDIFLLQCSTSVVQT